MITIHTDGSYFQKHKKGGWAATISSDGYQHVLYGSAKDTTNNRMEMLAVIKTLEFLPDNSVVLIKTDSRYVETSINKGTLYKWASNGWITSTGTAVKNQELWERILNQLNRHQVAFEHVKAHNGDLDNETCDQVAKIAALQQL